MLQIEDVTPVVQHEAEQADHEDREAGEVYTKRRPRMNFQEMDIPIGAELICTNNGESVVVHSDRTVIFRGEETSLTYATRMILEIPYSVQPGPYWTYNGQRLRDIYNSTYAYEE